MKKELTQDEIVKSLKSKSDPTKLNNKGLVLKSEFNLIDSGEAKADFQRKRRLGAKGKGSKEGEGEGEGESQTEAPMQLKTLKDFIDAVKDIPEGEDFAVSTSDEPVESGNFQLASIYRSTDSEPIDGKPNSVDYLNSDIKGLNDPNRQSKDKQGKESSVAFPHSSDFKSAEQQPSPVKQLAKFKKEEAKNPNDIVKVGSVYTFQYILDLLRSCVEMNEPALLIGETGVGKTHIVRELAKEHGKSLIRVSLNGSTSVEEIIGKWLAIKGTTVWQDGILLTAMKEGHWIVFDEINAALPEILFTLHSLLDDDRKVTLPEKDNSVIRPHEEFRFFSTMNPSEEYAGTKDLNKALVSRFTAVLNIEPLAEMHEVTVLTDNYAVSDEVALRLVSIATYLRKAKKEEKIFYFCSTRDIVQAGKLVVGGVNIELAIMGSILNKMSQDERNEVQKQVGGFITDPALANVDLKGMSAEVTKLKAAVKDKDYRNQVLEKSLDRLLKDMSLKVITEQKQALDKEAAEAK